MPRRARPKLETWQDYEAEALYQLRIAGDPYVELFGGPDIPMEKALRYAKIAETMKRLEDLHNDG